MAAQVTGVTGNAKVDLQFHFQGRGFTSAPPKRGKQFEVNWVTDEVKPTKGQFSAVRVYQ